MKPGEEDNSVGQASHSDCDDLEGAVLGVEGEAELDAATVVRHYEAVLAVLGSVAITNISDVAAPALNACYLSHHCQIVDVKN